MVFMNTLPLSCHIHELFATACMSLSHITFFNGTVNGKTYVITTFDPFQPLPPPSHFCPLPTPTHVHLTADLLKLKLGLVKM